MTDANDIARHAAQRLAARYGKELPMAVEKLILGGEEAAAQFSKTSDAASVAMAVAAYAALAWNILHGPHAGDSRPEPEAIHHELRLQLPAPKGLNAAARDEIIIIVTEEVVKK